ncbi:MAG: M28 family peptidase [Ignavibacteriales bacterium]|nr:M28 family peptidase [Ignavibacteriales bacterium]
MSASQTRPAPPRLSQQTIPAFDGDRAYAYLTKQTRFGPRSPGSSGHAKCLSYLLTELRRYTERVESQTFVSTLPDGKNVDLTNLIASFNTRAVSRVFISAHWDTRLWADQDPDKNNRGKPISGANDGASGVAVILELARQLRASLPSAGVDLILFDGEDLGKTGKPESFSAGSKYFASHMPAGFRPEFGINIDMIGDRSLKIFREQNSERLAPEVQNLVFGTAKILGITQFVDSPGEEITDDHLPLNGAGIPTIDLIDFSYPDDSNKYWHTLADTPDKCSAESLAAVGNVLMHVLYSHTSLKSKQP